MQPTLPGPDTRILPGFNRLAALTAVAVMVSGLLIFIGWAFDIALLKALLPGQETTKPLGALGFLLAGAALFLLLPAKAERPAWQHRTGLTCAGLTFLIGGLALLEYGLGVDLNVDRWLFREAVLAEPGPFPGRPVFLVSVCLALLGLALLAIQSRIIWFDSLVLIVLLVGLIAVVGYVYGAKDLSYIGPYRPVPPASALLLVLLALGYLSARPESPLLTPITTPLPAGMIARRLLPAAILVPLGLGWLRLSGQRLGFYDTELGLALFATSNMVVFASLVIWSARRLNEAEAQREATYIALRQSEERFRVLVNATPTGLLMVEADGKIVLANALAGSLIV